MKNIVMHNIRYNMKYVLVFLFPGNRVTLWLNSRDSCYVQVEGDEQYLKVLAIRYVYVEGKVQS